MMGQQSSATAGKLKVMITDGGAHSADAWAGNTAEQLLAIDKIMSPVRFQLALSLRNKIRERLRQHFRSIHPAMTAKSLDMIALSAADQVRTAASGTPWEMHFNEPGIRTEMALTIRRNLFSAADLALATE